MKYKRFEVEMRDLCRVLWAKMQLGGFSPADVDDSLLDEIEEGTSDEAEDYTLEDYKVMIRNLVKQASESLDFYQQRNNAAGRVVAELVERIENSNEKKEESKVNLSDLKDWSDGLTEHLAQDMIDQEQYKQDEEKND